jgi:hypothetical protein
MIKHCWYKLDLPVVGLLTDSRKSFDFDPDKPSIFHQKASAIFGDSLSGLEKLNIDIENVMIFYRPSWYNSGYAHIDLLSKPAVKAVTCAINVVIGGEDSTMHWYDEPADSREIKWTSAGTAYSSWRCNELLEIDQAVITREPFLVRVDVPHSITVRSQPRWCFSLRFRNQFSNWCEAIDKFQDLLMLRV